LLLAVLKNTESKAFAFHHFHLQTDFFITTAPACKNITACQALLGKIITARETK